MKEFNKKIQAQFDKMSKTGKLFRVSISGNEVWTEYLKAFGKDPVFRDPNSSEHNCNHCKNFIRRYGNIVSIDDNYSLNTIFDVEIGGEYSMVPHAMRELVKGSAIGEVFFETFDELNSLPYESCSKDNKVFKLGIDKNVKRYTKEEAEKFGVVKAEEVRTFNHLHLFIPTEFVDKTGKSVETIMGGFRDAKQVFKRAMDEISLDTLQLVKDLINQGSLLDGQTHLYKLEQVIPLKTEYDSLRSELKDSWCWDKSYKLPLAKFRNELIGTLCVELSQGEDLNTACQSWNKRVDPVNYMKTSAPITKKQIEEAKTFVEENGYAESFSRRMATMIDIKASEILHSNVGDGKIKSVSVFDSVKSTSTRHKRSEFDGVEEVTIENFMTKILPGCTSIEVFLKNIHENNMVSLTTANDSECKRIFKWNNNYSWTFNGNLAGKSQIKESVKTAGGRVDGVLRFSMIWNDGDGSDGSDLDAWCTQPNKERIGYSTNFRKDSGNRKSTCGGQLDLDNTHPQGKLAIENIYFESKAKLKNGAYRFSVHQFTPRSSQGFKAEIEFDGEIYSYEYNRPVSGEIAVANVSFEDGKFSIEHLLPESESSTKLVYGLETNQFQKVNLLCLSPNHWGDQVVGNKHYLFMLEGCKSPVSIRSFHNENLIPELQLHRKVMEVLGATNMVPSIDNQLSGLGFNATVSDELIVKLSGTHKRVIKIKF